MAAGGPQALGVLPQIAAWAKDSKLGKIALGAGAIGTAATFSDDILNSIKNAAAPFTKPGQWLQSFFENAKQNEMFSSTTTGVRNTFVGIAEFFKVVVDIFTGKINLGDIMSGKISASEAFSSTKGREADAAALAPNAPGANGPNGPGYNDGQLDGGDWAGIAGASAIVAGTAVVANKLAPKPPTGNIKLNPVAAKPNALVALGEDLSAKLPKPLKLLGAGLAGVGVIWAGKEILTPKPAVAAEMPVTEPVETIPDEKTLSELSQSEIVVQEPPIANSGRLREHYVPASEEGTVETFDGKRVAAVTIDGFYDGNIEMAGNILGAPIDGLNWLIDQIPGIDASKTPVLGSEFIKSALGGGKDAYYQAVSPIAPSLSNLEPRNDAEQLGYMGGNIVGQFTGAAIGGGSMALATKTLTTTGTALTTSEKIITKTVENAVWAPLPSNG